MENKNQKEKEKQEEKEEKKQEETAQKAGEEKKEQAKEKPAKPAGKIGGPKEVKHEAVVRSENLPISTKHAIAICRFIKGKTIQKAVSDLEQVIKLKKAVLFRGEIPHRAGKGISSGRYPIKAAKQFIKLLKNLSANASVNDLNLDKIRISAKADTSSRRRFSRKYRKFKRTYVLITAREIEKQENKLKEKSEK